AGLVHLVDALVAQVAVAVSVDPVPVVVEFRPHDRQLRGRAAPQVVVDAGGRLGRLLHLPHAPAGLVAPADGQIDLAELAALDVGDGVAHALGTAALGADLADPVELPGGSQHDRAFLDVVAGRLLAVHVLAVLHGPDGHQGVPVVRGGDGDDVDVLVLDHPADVLLVLRGFPLRRFDPLHRVADDCLVAVAHDGDLGVDVPVGEPGDVAHAPAVDADDGDPQPVVGGAGPGGGERLGLGEGGSAGGGRG